MDDVQWIVVQTESSYTHSHGIAGKTVFATRDDAEAHRALLARKYADNPRASVYVIAESRSTT